MRPAAFWLVPQAVNLYFGLPNPLVWTLRRGVSSHFFFESARQWNNRGIVRLPMGSVGPNMKPCI